MVIQEKKKRKKEKLDSTRWSATPDLNKDKRIRVVGKHLPTSVALKERAVAKNQDKKISQSWVAEEGFRLVTDQSGIG